MNYKCIGCRKNLLSYHCVNILCGPCYVLINNQCKFHNGKSRNNKSPRNKIKGVELTKEYDYEDIKKEIDKIIYIPTCISNLLLDYVDNRDICNNCNHKYHNVKELVCFKCDIDICELCGMLVDESCDSCYCCKKCYKLHEVCVKCNKYLCCFSGCNKCLVCKKVFCQVCANILIQNVHIHSIKFQSIFYLT